MPINYKKYPSNWKTQIRPDILKRANNKCEFCGLENYLFGYRDSRGKFHISEGMQSEADLLDGEKIIKIVLTIAHLDHNINNNDYSNLRALCQKCHNCLDVEYRKHNRKYKNQPSLPF